MTPKQKQEVLHEMFQSDGWKVLKEQLVEQEATINQITSVDDEKQLYFSKGRLFCIRECLILPELVKAALDEEEYDTE